MPRKNYTPAERALHILGVLAGKSRQEINDTKQEAELAGESAAQEWCIINEVDWNRDDG